MPSTPAMHQPRRRLEETANEVLSLIQQQEFAQALRELNASVPHRFTAIFKIDGDRVRNVLLFDKLDEPVPEPLTNFPLADSFCQFVLRDSFLHVDDSTREPMLAGSPYQGVIRAYHAVALTLLGAEVVGTLAHFDLAPQTLDQEHFALLVLASRTLPEILVASEVWR
jgi:GAF domain-containing protein